MPARKKNKVWKTLLLEHQGPVVQVYLNRPETKNAFNMELAGELGEALREIAQDKNIRAVILRGKGGAFSSGGDLKMFHAALPKPAPAFRKISTLLNAAIKLIRGMPKPVIAGLQGPAYAAAFGLTLACDLIFASELATLSASYIKVALCPNASASLFLPRLVGFHRASEALLTGRVFSAQEAYDWGIVNRVLPEAEFDSALLSFAQDLASRPSATLARTKLLLNQSLGFHWQAQLEREKEAIAWSSTTPDFAKRVTAFVEKKKG